VERPAKEQACLFYPTLHSGRCVGLTRRAPSRTMQGLKTWCIAAGTFGRWRAVRVSQTLCCKLPCVTLQVSNCLSSNRMYQNRHFILSLLSGSVSVGQDQRNPFGGGSRACEPRFSGSGAPLQLFLEFFCTHLCRRMRRMRTILNAVVLGSHRPEGAPGKLLEGDRRSWACRCE
jgi:hypothetical protein